MTNIKPREKSLIQIHATVL